MNIKNVWERLRKWWAIAAVLVVVAAFMINAVALNKSNEPKCPEDYADTDAGFAEQLNAFEEWTNDFFDTHPEASLSDWSQARIQFYIDNNCTEALERYKEAKNGRADPVKMKIIDDVIEETIKN